MTDPELTRAYAGRDTPMYLSVAARTDRGRERLENQDDFLVADLSVPADLDAGQELHHLLLCGGQDGV
jgi:hypothetical protein